MSQVVSAPDPVCRPRDTCPPDQCVHWPGTRADLQLQTATGAGSGPQWDHHQQILLPLQSGPGPGQTAAARCRGVRCWPVSGQKSQVIVGCCHGGQQSGGPGAPLTQLSGPGQRSGPSGHSQGGGGSCPAPASRWLDCLWGWQVLCWLHLWSWGGGKMLWTVWCWYQADAE